MEIVPAKIKDFKKSELKELEASIKEDIEWGLYEETKDHQ